jgi:hypothetical protein
VLGQQEERPREHRGRRLVARDQQGHQVVAKLLRCDVVACGTNEARYCLKNYCKQVEYVFGTSSSVIRHIIQKHRYYSCQISGAMVANY